MAKPELVTSAHKKCKGRSDEVVSVGQTKQVKDKDGTSEIRRGGLGRRGKKEG